jgi:hypothetical protein
MIRALLHRGQYDDKAGTIFPFRLCHLVVAQKKLYKFYAQRLDFDRESRNHLASFRASEFLSFL